MRKNVASQVVGAQLVSATDGSAFTGAVTVAVTGDGGAQATGSVGSGACTHEGGGFHTYAPAQAETNYNHVAFTFSGTGAVPVTVQIYTTSLNPHDTVRAGLTALPNAAADAAGGLIISDAGGLDADAQIVTKINSILDDTDLIDDGTSGLAKIATDVAAILLDTGTTLQNELDGIQADTEDIQSKIGTPAVTLAADIAAIEAQTDDIGALGAGLTAIIGADGDTLKSLSDQIDGLSTSAAPQLLQNTTIATLASQTSFTLTDGSADDNAYNGAIVVVTDASTATQKAVGVISDYTGSTKTVTLSADPGIFTMAVGDTVDVLAAISSAPTVTQIRQEMDSNSTQLAAIVADTNELQTDWANGGRLDLLIDAVKAKTDSLTFTVSNQLDSNMVAISGDTTAADTLELFAEAIDQSTGQLDGDTFASGAFVKVWSHDLAGGVWLTGAAGKMLETVFDDWANGGRLDLILDATATAFALASLVTTVGVAGAGLTEAGGTGDHLTALGTAAELAKVPKSDSNVTWNATALASIQSEATDALNAYDPPTNAEFEARTLVAANYFDPTADTVANVTTVESVATKTGYSLTSAEHTSIADATLARAVSNVEATADKHSLALVVALATNAAESGGTLTAKKPSDDSTWFTYTVTSDDTADPITGIS